MGSSFIIAVIEQVQISMALMTASGQKVFDILVAEIESIVEPNYLGNDIWWEAVTLVSIHRPIIRYPQLS
jgi:hypothetical protein